MVGGGYMSDTWEWDGSSWNQVSSSGPSPRRQHAMAYDSQRGVVVLFGGHGLGGGGLMYLGDTWEWNGSSWSQVSSGGPSARDAHAMAYDSQRGVTVLLGGGQIQGQSQVTTSFSDTWEWDGGSWSQASGGMPSVQPGHAMAYDSQRGRMVLCGGPGGGISNGVLVDTWEWDGSSWSQIGSNAPQARSAHAMAYDSQRDRTVLFGGAIPGAYIGDTWEWDGSSWNQVGSTGPQARSAHAMAYDSQRGVTVLFGGSAYGPQGDTWMWDGTTWTQVSTTGPSVRYAHGMVYDSQRGVIVLFGGFDNSNLGDTWEWDGTTWTQVSISGPPAGFVDAMAYDSQRGRTVLLRRSGDTWEWDGVSWAHVASNGPDSCGAMAYDSVRAKTVLFGGDGAGSFSNSDDTWEWDGSSWNQIGSNGPQARRAHAMAYDSQRGRMVLFGGSEAPNIYLGDTWELGFRATVSGFGDGCGLHLVPMAMPVIGTTAQAILGSSLSPVTASQIWVMFGMSNTAWGTATLPLELTSFGMPGCYLLTSGESGMVGTTPVTPAVSVANLALPNTALLIGLRVFMQGVAFSPFANSANIITSNGLELVIGT